MAASKRRKNDNEKRRAMDKAKDEAAKKARRKEAAKKGAHTRRVNTLKRRMAEILKSLPPDKRFIVQEMANNFVFLSIQIMELREQLENESVIVRYNNGGGQYGLKENTKLSIYQKLLTRHSDLTMKLVKILPEDEEDTRDELEKFLGFSS